MEIDLQNLSPDQARDLIVRLQNLEFENERLRNAATPVTQPAPILESVGGFPHMKVMPRPDKYDGDRKKNKVKEFSRKIQRYLRCMPNIEPKYHVDIISGFLTGTADTWFHRWSKDKINPTADELLDDLVCQFCPANVSQEARRKLATLKQRTSVNEYSMKFREILEEVESISESESKTYYINGLKDSVKKEVLLKDLYDDLSLDKVEQMAVQIDSIVFQNRPQYRGTNYTRQSVNRDDPMEGVQFGRLTLEEQAKFRKEDRCFSCKRQKEHESGCKSRYVFKNNLNLEQARYEEPRSDLGDAAPPQ